ncbi:MAG: cryptochrome/photolyase family protein [Nevskiales bacterium]
MTTIVWFRRDLRVADNPALLSAVERGTVLPVYIHAPHEEAPWAPGAASLWWLHHSLKALQQNLKALGLPLIILQGDSLNCLQQLVRDTEADAVFWNRLYEPAIIARDAEIKKILRDRDIEARSFNAGLLLEPWQVENKQGKPFRVFTPFWRHFIGLLDAAPPVAELPPEQPRAAEYHGANLALEELALLPKLDWDRGFYDNWTPGEQAAQDQLKYALEVIDSYNDSRDMPGQFGTSRLSPHLHFGEISPAQVWTTVKQQAAGSANDKENRLGYLRQLIWREFGHHLIYHFPETANTPLNDRFKAYPWWQSGDDDNNGHAEKLAAWQRGETGIAMVDAGMRELWTTGWMHNRTRMIVASLLTKNLGIHWLEGARWFWDTLVDANLANNTLGWQWTAGCGADAAPFFRIFNPDTQAERFDARGEYRRQWLGSDWASRPSMVNLKASRETALDHYKALPKADN